MIRVGKANVEICQETVCKRKCQSSQHLNETARLTDVAIRVGCSPGCIHLLQYLSRLGQVLSFKPFSRFVVSGGRAEGREYFPLTSGHNFAGCSIYDFKPNSTGSEGQDLYTWEWLRLYHTELTKDLLGCPSDNVPQDAEDLLRTCSP